MSKKLYEKMNLYLANQEVAYIKLHNLHWYVKGRSFFTLHAKLEELYDRTAEIIDAVAERLLADAAGDGVTADQFNDYLGEYQKLLWMLRSYIA